MVGQTVAHYRIVERIGAGGMGVVYKAEDLRLGRAVALKFLSPELSSSPTAVERFMREARTASSLNHPNICTIYSIEETEGHRFLAMELLEGQSLHEVINGRPMPIDTVINLGLQIAEALDTAHTQGVLHRDVKPANIFVTRRGLVKVLDFGLAKLALLARDSDALDSSPTMAEVMLTTQGLALGTVAYMSPEQARGEALDARSDIFSFGIVLYEMLTGQQAFSGRTSAVVFDAILNREPPAPSLFQANVPADLEQIVIQALDKDPVGRFQTMAELKAELARVKRERESGQYLAATAARDDAGPENALADDETPTVLVRRPRPSSASAARISTASAAVSAASHEMAVTALRTPPAQPVAAPVHSPTSGSGLDLGVAQAAPVALAGVDVAPRAVVPPPPTAPVPVAVPTARTATRARPAPGKALAIGAICVVLVAAAAVLVWWSGHGSAETAVTGAAAGDESLAPAPLATNEAAEAAIASVATTAVPGEVNPAAPARPARSTAPRQPAPVPTLTPAAPAPLEATAIVPALPRASPQRVDPGGLLLSAARTKYDAKLLDQALADVQTILRDHPSSTSAPVACLLSARIQSQQGNVGEAIAALSQLRNQFSSNAANAEGSVLLAQLLGRTKRSDRVPLARQVLIEVPQRFPDSPWAPRALAQRAQLETRERVKDTHPSLGTVPAALLTNRVLTEKYPTAPEAEFAYWQLGGDYEDRKAYALAAAAFTELGTRFPQTKFDAWWRAGELYTKRLKNQAAAKAAYARVPPTSPKYKDAQKRLKEK